MPHSSHTPLRVAVIGCGAVTRGNLMPVLAGHEGLSVVALVDRSRDRAEQLAKAYGIARVETDMDAVRGDVDAVVLATPPSHHAPATRTAAARGKHIFVEKPMAITSADAQSMTDAASAANVVLSVGLYRRLLPSVKLLRSLIATREFGRPLSIDAEEGGPYGWQLASLDGLTRAAGGGGVLIDIGSHVLDVLLHVVPGVATLTSASDNARGGIETDTELTFTIAHDGASVPVRVELSRTRELRGTIRVECEQATLELLRADFLQLVVHPKRAPRAGTRPAPAGAAVGAGLAPALTAPYRLLAEWQGQGPYVGYQAFRDEIDDWVNAIRSGDTPILSGQSVVPVVRLIEDTYRQPTPQGEPWTDEGLTPAHRVEVASPRRRVLVTGAGGFLGGRATEVLRERYGWDVVGLVRSPSGASRLARWPGEIVLGDVCVAADMDRAVKGCDAVVHCAVGTIWPPDAARRVTVEGTKTVAEAARRAGVRRFVHISTLFVHRRTGSGTLDESVQLEPPANDDYGQAKLAAERALAEVAKAGLSTVTLRPVRIYGPFSKTFTIRPLEAIGQNRFAIGGDPDVPANMVYVDNVVEAMARAIEAGGNVSGSAYLVADADQISLAQFFGWFAEEAGHTDGIPVVAQAAARTAVPVGLASRWLGGVKAIATSPELRSMVRRVFETDPMGPLPRKLWESSPAMQQTLLKRFGADAAVIYRPTATEAAQPLVYNGEPGRVSIDKARRELGFEPPVSRERAMALTLQWARHARLL